MRRMKAHFCPSVETRLHIYSAKCQQSTQFTGVIYHLTLDSSHHLRPLKL